eukprot:CFRG6428T1
MDMDTSPPKPSLSSSSRAINNYTQPRRSINYFKERNLTSVESSSEIQVKDHADVHSWIDYLKRGHDIDSTIMKYNNLVKPSDAHILSEQRDVMIAMRRLANSAEDKDVTKLLKWFATVRKGDPRAIDVSVYTKLIRRCQHLKNTDLSWDVFGDMRFHNVKLNSFVYGTMMISCMMKQEAERALELYMEMKEKRIRVSSTTFAILIQATATRADMHERTFELLSLYLAEGHLPTPELMSSLLFSCAKAGNVRSAHQIWNRLQERDPNNPYAMQPTTRMYTNLVKVYIGAIRHEVPLALARSTKVEHKALTYKQVSEIILSDTGDVGSLSAVLAEDNMKAKKIAEVEEAQASHNPTTNEEGLATKAPELLSLNPRPSVNVLLKHVEGAISRMKADGLRPDIHTAAALIEAYTWSQQLDKAVDVLHTLKERTGVEPVTECYGHVIDCAVKLGQLNTAMDLYEEFMDKKIIPVPFGQRMQTPKSKQSFLAETKPSRCSIGYQKMHVALINACVEAGAYAKAVSILKHLCKVGGTPKPEYMLRFRTTCFDRDVTEYWDQAKALCMKHDILNEWAIIDIRYKDAAKRYKPRKLKYYNKRQSLPGVESDLEIRLHPKPNPDPNVEIRALREKMRKKQTRSDKSR